LHAWVSKGNHLRSVSQELVKIPGWTNETDPSDAIKTSGLDPISEEAML